MIFVDLKTLYPYFQDPILTSATAVTANHSIKKTGKRTYRFFIFYIKPRAIARLSAVRIFVVARLL